MERVLFLLLLVAEASGQVGVTAGYLLLSTRNSVIRLVDASNMTRNDTVVIKTREGLLPIHTMKNIRALTHDPVEDMIYSVVKLRYKTKNVMRVHENGGKAVALFDDPTSKHIRPFDIDIDPFTRTLYWTCSRDKVIKVTLIDMPNFPTGVILGKGKQGMKPVTIAVYPEKGVVFYTNLFYESPRIEKAWMDGSMPTVVIEKAHGSPPALTIDKDENTAVQ